MLNKGPKIIKMKWSGGAGTWNLVYNIGKS